MSSNLDIGGLLAKLLNYDEESSESITSTRNLEPVSLSKALNNNQSKEGGNQTLKSANPTKKAIVLQPVAGTPTATTPEEKTTWLESALAILTGFGATPVQTKTMTATYVSNFPEYWVWVLPDSTRNVAEFPAFQGTSTVFNVERFTKCVVNDAAIEIDLLQGACVRIDYENRNHLGGAYVVNVINNERDFANAVILELGGIPSAGGGFGACDESGVSVKHPTGDAIAPSGPKDDPTFRKCAVPAAAYAHLEKRATYWPPQQTSQQVMDAIRQSGQPDDVQRIMWLIIAHEQPRFRFLNYNVAGIQLDTTSFSGTTPSDFDYMTCYRDSGGDQRIFAGFSDLNRGMTTFGKTIAGKVSIWKALVGTVGQMAELMTWNYYHSWNLALDEAELVLLKSQGYVIRDGVRITRHWEQSAKTFSQALDKWNA